MMPAATWLPHQVVVATLVAIMFAYGTGCFVWCLLLHLFAKQTTGRYKRQYSHQTVQRGLAGYYKTYAEIEYEAGGETRTMILPIRRPVLGIGGGLRSLVMDRLLLHYFASRPDKPYVLRRYIAAGFSTVALGGILTLFFLI